MRKRVASAMLCMTLSVSMAGTSVFAQEMTTPDISSEVVYEESVEAELEEVSEAESVEEVSEEEVSSESIEESVILEETEAEAEAESEAEAEASIEASEEIIEEMNKDMSFIDKAVIEAVISEEAAEVSEEVSEEAEVVEIVDEEEGEAELAAAFVETVEVEDFETGEMREVDVYAAEGGFQYYMENDKAIIYGYTGSATSLRLPLTLKRGGKDVSVSGIGVGAFKSKSSLTAVNIPASYKVIGDYAFWGCPNLKSVTLSEGIEEIGAGAFKGCKVLAAAIIPSSIFVIGDNAFSDCPKLAAVNVKSRFTGQYMFANCPALKTATLTSALEAVGNYTFQNCTALNKAVLPADLQMIGDGAFESCEALTDVNFGTKLKVIGSTAYQGCKGITSIIIPSSVEAMGEFAFAYCEKLEKVSLTDGLTTIGGAAFASNEKLTTIYIPATVKKIGASAFINSSVNKGMVYCIKGSAADNASLYPAGTTFTYSKPVIALPTFKVRGFVGGRYMTVTSETKDAVIYYSSTTSKLTTSDKHIKNGGTITFNGFYGTLYFRAYANGQWSNVARFIMKVPTVNTPVITQKGDTITISSTTPDALIYYTTDGTTPTLKSTCVPKNTCSIKMTKGVVKAIAVRDCFANSQVASFSIAPTENKNIASPTFTVVGVIGGKNVTFKSTQKGGDIYYSTKEQMSLTDSKVANGGTVTFNSFNGTLYARTYIDGQWSQASKITLEVPKVADPVITRSYTSGVMTGYVNIETSTPECIIYYTVDGSTPSVTNGRKVTGSSVKAYVGLGVTVKAIAVRNAYASSQVVTYK